MVTYTFCGFDPKERFGNEASKALKKDLKTARQIVFIPGMMASQEKTKKYVDTDIEWFKEIGINFETFSILDENTTPEEAKSKLELADVVFLMGGDAVKQDAFLSNYGLKPLIKKFPGTVIGVSAGAINLCDISLRSIDLKYGFNETELYRGIGRLRYTFEPHFSIDDKVLLENELFPLSRKMNIYGLSDGSGIRFENGSFQLLSGSIYSIRNNVIKVFKNKECREELEF